MALSVARAIPTIIRISPRKDGVTAKTKCLNPQKSHKRKLSNAIFSYLIPILKRYSSINSIDHFRGTKTNLLNLPKEIFINILSFLDCKSIHKLSRTCHKMHAICQDRALWQTLLYAEFRITHVEFDAYKTYQHYFKLQQNWRKGHVETRFMQGHEGSVYSLDWVNTETIVSGGKDRSIKFWDCKTGECLHTVNEAHQGSILCLKVYPGLLLSGSTDATCTVWRLPGMTPLHTFTGLEGSILDVCMMGRLIVTASKDHTVHVWNLDTGLEHRQLLGHVSSIAPIDQDRLASASKDGTIKIWNVQTGACLLSIETQDSLEVVRYNGQYLFSGGKGGKIHAWDVNTGDCVHTLCGHGLKIRSIAFIEGKIVSSGNDRSIKVWDAKTGACLLSFGNAQSTWIAGVLASNTRILSCEDKSRIMMLDFGSYLKCLK